HGGRRRYYLRKFDRARSNGRDLRTEEILGVIGSLTSYQSTFKDCQPQKQFAISDHENYEKHRHAIASDLPDPRWLVRVRLEPGASHFSALPRSTGRRRLHSDR